jgi:hypothetical protein
VLANTGVCLHHQNNKTMDNNIQYNNSNGNRRTTLGIILVVLGGIFLINQFAGFVLPYWLFSWPMWMIAAGVISGVRHNFRKPWSITLIVIGSIFLANMALGFNYVLFWPLVLIAIGVRMVFFRDSHWCRDRWERRNQWSQQAHTDYRDTL